MWNSRDFFLFVPLLVILFFCEVKWNKAALVPVDPPELSFSMYRPYTLQVKSEPVHAKPFDTSILSYPPSNHSVLLDQLVHFAARWLRSRKRYNQTSI